MRFMHVGPLFCTAFRHLGQPPIETELPDLGGTPLIGKIIAAFMHHIRSVWFI